MTISELVTANFPVTESELLAYTAIEYADIKALMIERAKRDLYGSGISVPSEADIPDVAQYWIADKATIYLLQTGREYYVTKYRLSDSKENANFSFYNRIDQLNRLEDELKASIERNRDVALNAISASRGSSATVSSPAVSVSGLLVDPVRRAAMRGPF